MPLSLPLRLLHIAAVAVMLAVVDWSLKTWALADLHDHVVLNTDRPWHVIPVSVLIGAGLVAAARTPLLAFGAGVVIGGGLGNMGELAIFGRVTDFIPLGIPFRGAVWSPGDLFLAAGLVLLWIGVVRARGQVPAPPPRPTPGCSADGITAHPTPDSSRRSRPAAA
jgi:lipoprotein signal peptidase